MVGGEEPVVGMYGSCGGVLLFFALSVWKSGEAKRILFLLRKLGKKYVCIHAFSRELRM